MKINIIYLIVGIFNLLSAFTQTRDGLKNALNILNNSEIDNGTKIVLTYVWHIVGIENLVIGIALLIMAFIKVKENVKFTAWVIIAILIARLIVTPIFTFMKSKSGLFDILIDTIALIGMIILLFFGTILNSKAIIKKQKTSA